MSRAREEQHEQETRIYQCSNEAGVRALRAWLSDFQTRTNRAWPDTFGDALGQLQGEARLVARLIRLIDDGPRIKSIEGTTHGT